MGTIPRSQAGGIDHLQIGFMDQGGRVDRVPLSLTAKMSVGDLAQLVVQKPHQTIMRLGVSTTPGVKKYGYVFGLGLH
jgi:hypothetical protein